MAGKQTPETLVRIAVKLPPRMLEKIDSRTRPEDAVNRSDVIRQLLAAALKERSR